MSDLPSKEELVEAGAKAIFASAEHRGGTRWEQADALMQIYCRNDARAVLTAVLPRVVGAAVEAEREECAKVADSDIMRECPYETDKKGDPTWDHTDEDVCPVCKVKGKDSFKECVGIARNRIAAAIRARTVSDQLRALVK